MLIFRKPVDPASSTCTCSMASLPAEPGWAPLVYRFSGIWEIQPAALQERTAGDQADDIQIIDVGGTRPIGGQGLPIGRAVGAGHGAAAEGRLQAARQSSLWYRPPQPSESTSP